MTRIELHPAFDSAHLTGGVVHILLSILFRCSDRSDERASLSLVMTKARCRIRHIQIDLARPDARNMYYTRSLVIAELARHMVRTLLGAARKDRSVKGEKRRKLSV